MIATEENSVNVTIYKKGEDKFHLLYERISGIDACDAIDKCVKKISAKTRLHIELKMTAGDFIVLSNNIKRKFWKNNNKIESFHFKIIFFNRDELNIDFAIALSIFALWRKDFCDSFIFDCCQLTTNEILAFKNKVC